MWQFRFIAGGGHVLHGRGITPHHPPFRVGILPFDSRSAVRAATERLS